MDKTGKIIIAILILGLILFLAYSWFLKNKTNDIRNLPPVGQDQVQYLTDTTQRFNNYNFNDYGIPTNQRTIVLMNSNNDGRGRFSFHH